MEESLRPGWSKHELLTPERFESLLGAGLADLRCQVIEADSLADLGRYVASEVKEAVDEAAAES